MLLYFKMGENDIQKLDLGRFLISQIIKICEMPGERRKTPRRRRLLSPGFLSAKW